MPQYRRILLKISGEALAGPLSFGLEPDRVTALAAEVAGVARTGVQIGLGVGRRQHLSRDCRRCSPHGPGAGRPHGHAGYCHQCAGLPGCSGKTRRPDARHDCYSDASGR